MELAIETTELSTRYRGAEDDAGLNGIDLHVRAGTVCGLLGPNGAGKTTMIRILSTLLRPDSGTAFVAGYDVARQAKLVRERIGLVGQSAALDEVLSGRQNLDLFGRLNNLSAKDAGRRADELLERFGLSDTGRKPVGKYSGGMRRRLDLAASLITAPPVLFVDEPTTGLDPAGRRDVWAAIETLVQSGTTVLLTTQYLEEADELANDIVLLSAGRVIAEGTPSQLKARIGTDWLEVVLDDVDTARATADLARSVTAAEIAIDPATRTVRVPVADHAIALVDLAVALRSAGIAPRNLAVRRPTLDEVFLELTSTAKSAA
jgi:ABC-2 type transport system ATP-binding protein